MSRSSHQRQQQKLQQQQQLLAQQQQMADNESAAAAAELFDLFCVATTMRQVLGLHRNMCDLIGLRPAPLNEFYPKLKAKIRSWKAQALWKKFDARAAHRAYAKGTAATGTRVLVIGAGPCGLRTAIEAQLLGAKVVVVEKRDRISRNNVLHLWPFVITDLRNLGAKKFYGKFCAGSIDHISIRQIQCILLKVALLLGVEIHEGVSFEGTIEPNGDGCGWRAAVSPEDHAASHYEFDVLIGADGKRNTLEGFKRKEFRGKLAIAITANFINKKTEAEAKAEEISGVAFIFNQSFFKELYHTTGIDLENIVYYKDETHYFVMTAKKHSLIDKGVIMQDFADPAELLATANVNTEKLLDYAREAAEFSTKYQMPNLEFAVNHYGKPDVAMFDFTSMFAAETSCRAVVRKGFRLLQCLVGDSLLEPFWPTGSGCARGFLSSMDAAYAIKLWSNPHNSTLGVLAQRESIYRLLNQTTPENLQRDIGSYTVDPATRYPNLNRTSVNVWQVKHLIDSDDASVLEQTFMDTNALQATQVDTPVRRKRRSGDSLPLSTVLLRWICAQLHSYEFTRSLKEVSDVFTHGKVLCALINRYRPDLVDLNAIKDLSSVECNDIAFRVLEKELNIPRIMTGKDAQKLNNIESKIWLNYLEQICEVFRGEIPHVKHPKMDFSELRDKHRYNANAQPDFSKLLQLSTKHKAKSSMQDMVDNTPVHGSKSIGLGTRKHATEDTAKVADQQGHTDTPRRAKKRRSAEKAANIEERQKRLQEIEQNRQDRQSKRRQQRYQQTQNFYKSLHMLQANTLLRESDEATAFEDYSIFMYRQQAPVFNDRVKELERKLLFPDRERSDIPSAQPRNATDEQFSDRIKSMEQRITSRNTYGTEKKPKDLMRAIGKIDSNDWNVREIEKKIEQSKKTEIHGPKGREKVPKWSKEQFVARQNKMSKPLRQDSGEEKFKEIDQTLKNLDKQLKEGSVLEIGERGRNKVASIAGQFVKKDDTSEEKNPPTVVQKSSSKVALAFKKQAASEKCHFCKQTVYLMEKITTEGLILHRSCLKCYHCHTNLRPGGYAFDRDDPNGHFYCTQHFRLPAKAIRPVVRKPGQRKPTQQQQAAAAAAANAIPKNEGEDESAVVGEPKTPDKLRGHADSVAQLDLLDRGQTPERIEFENTDAMSDGEPSEEHIIDENEWSGRNFLPESNNDSESDLSSSEESGSESDSDIFEEANDSPLGVQTLQLATDWIGKQNYSDSDDSDDFYDSSDGIADDGKDDTEGEEFKKARELRREEVRLLPLPANLPTDTETEYKLSANENTENIAIKTNQLSEENQSKSVNSIDFDKQSEISCNSEKSYLSTSLHLKGEQSEGRRGSCTSKADMEKIEQNCDRKLTVEVDEISEKLYRLNNMVQLNKDLESLAKENLIQSDIKKKLTLKEKWLANNSASISNADDVKSKFDEKLVKLFGTLNSEVAGKGKGKGKDKENVDVIQDTKTKIPLKRCDSSTKETNTPTNIENTSPYVERKSTTNASRSASFKSTNSSSPKLTSKNINVSHSSSVKKSEVVSNENKMQLENILDIVKNINLSGSESKEPPESLLSDNDKLSNYEEAHSFAKSQRGINEKLKEIESKSFAGTMDSIKSQIIMPTVSSQAASSVDLSKYFPNQKQEKASAGAINKTQKNLKDVDLTKYFPSSPVPQKRTTLTVAEKLKKAQTEGVPLAEPHVDKFGKDPLSSSQENTKSQILLENTAVSLREHQLDGAVDLSRRKSPVVKTSTATATLTKKGNIKIIKKIVPKGTKARKAAEAESERILDEILHIDDQDEIRSPSIEYKKLFDEEKSPSEDISDKIESILEETGINLGLPKKPSRNKTMAIQKAKSLGEAELDRHRGSTYEKSSNSSLSAQEDSDPPVKGVQNILKRFESLSTFKSQEKPFKLQRMESSTSNLNKSRESLVSRESDSLSDLDKTMEYLKTGWRNEATNFLQKKRDKFYAHKRSVDETVAASKEEQKKSKLNELPVQYRESKLSKFFGFKQKSPEKKKSPVQKKVKDKNKNIENDIFLEKRTQPATSGKHSENEVKPHYKEISGGLKISDEEAFLLSLPTSSFSNLSSKEAKKSSDNITTKDSTQDTEEKVTNASEIITHSERNETAYESLKEQSSVSNEGMKGAADGSEMLTQNAGGIEESTRNTLVGARLPSNTSAENRRPLVEDIKNLPKFGCDKSQNNSRRGSQSSLQSRRQSDSSLTEQLEKAAFELSKTNSNQSKTSVENIFQEIVKQIDGPNASPKDLPIGKNESEEVQEFSRARDSKGEDSLSHSLSKSLPQATVQIRGSSEEESIEKLFCEFSNDMLVDVEFDSNDDLIAITPRPMKDNMVETEVEADKDYLGKLESLEKDPEVVEDNIIKLETQLDTFELDKKSMSGSNESLINSKGTIHFPVRPQRRQKSTSSSSEPSVPIAPQRFKKKYLSIDQNVESPSMLSVCVTQVESNKVNASDIAPLKSYRKIYEDENFATIISENADNQHEKKELKKTEETKDIQKICSRGAEEDITSDMSLNTFNVVKNVSKEQENFESKKEMNQNETSYSIGVPPEQRVSGLSQETSSSDNFFNSPPVQKENELLNNNGKKELSENKALVKLQELSLQSVEDKQREILITIESKSSNSIENMFDKNSEKQTNCKEKSEKAEEHSAPSIYLSSTKMMINPKHSVHAKKDKQHFTEKTIKDSSTNFCSQAIGEETINDKRSQDSMRYKNTNRKEEILDWDMEKIPASPMPRRKYVHTEKSSNKEANNKALQLSSASSTKGSNGIQKLQETPADNISEEELLQIEKYAQERRKSLVKRDKEYAEQHKVLDASMLTRRGSKVSTDSETCYVQANSNSSSINDLTSVHEKELRQALINCGREYEKCQNILTERRQNITSANENDLATVSNNAIEELQCKSASKMTSQESVSKNSATTDSEDMKRKSGEVKGESNLRTCVHTGPIPSSQTNMNTIFDKSSTNKMEDKTDKKLLLQSSSSKEVLPSSDSIQGMISAKKLKEECGKDLSERCNESLEGYKENTQISEIKQIKHSFPTSSDVFDKDLGRVSIELVKNNNEEEETSVVNISKLSDAAEKKEGEHSKKVQLFTRKGVPIYIPDSDDNDDPIPEVFKNRVWPKRDDDIRSKSVESGDDVEKFVRRLREGCSIPKSESPLNDEFEKRVWSRSHHRYRQRDNNGPSLIRKNSSPNDSTHSLKPGQPSSSQCSIDTDMNSLISSRSTEPLPLTPQRHKMIMSAVDSGTKLLLDRSKDLHDRKRDFINERVAERNSYTKTRFINNSTYDVSSDDDKDDVDLESYRPRNHTSTITARYPTTRTSMGSNTKRTKDYLRTTPTSLYPGLRSSGGSKRLYTPTVPTAAASSSESYLRYPSHSTAYLASSTIPTRSHFTDYFKRSPSNYRDRSGELSKESCVIS